MKRLVGLCVLSAACTTGVWNSAHAQSMEARQLMQATNEDRAQQGLGPLKWDPALARAAQTHAETHGAAGRHIASICGRIRSGDARRPRRRALSRGGGKSRRRADSLPHVEDRVDALAAPSQKYS